jgi:mannose-6-phosphate isomerase-like protein (cupin superfamily)
LHEHAYNQFYVISGVLVVKTDVGPNRQVNYTRVYPKQSFTVPPGVTHEFYTLDKSTIVEEIAYVKYNIHDIDRKELGGDY